MKTRTSLDFVMFVDLGTIVVPESYQHSNRLKSLGKNIEGCMYYDSAINDKNFSNPSKILKKGDKLRVRGYKATTPDISMFMTKHFSFLKKKKSVLVGAQGLSLVAEQKRNLLLKGDYNYISLDKKDRLFVENGISYAPCMTMTSDRFLCIGLDPINYDYKNAVGTSLEEDRSKLICLCFTYIGNIKS